MYVLAICSNMSFISWNILIYPWHLVAVVLTSQFSSECLWQRNLITLFDVLTLMSTKTICCVICGVAHCKQHKCQFYIRRWKCRSKNQWAGGMGWAAEMPSPEWKPWRTYGRWSWRRWKPLSPYHRAPRRLQPQGAPPAVTWMTSWLTFSCCPNVVRLKTSGRGAVGFYSLFR